MGSKSRRGPVRKLYDVEHRGKSISPSTLQQLRQMSSEPVLSRIKAWLERVMHLLRAG